MSIDKKRPADLKTFLFTIKMMETLNLGLIAGFIVPIIVYTTTENLFIFTVLVATAITLIFTILLFFYINSGCIGASIESIWYQRLSYLFYFSTIMSWVILYSLITMRYGICSISISITFLVYLIFINVATS